MIWCTKVAAGGKCHLRPGERDTMEIAYFDCFCGATGDMIVAACHDAGVLAYYLRGELSKLNLPEDVKSEITKVKRDGISAT